MNHNHILHFVSHCYVLLCAKYTPRRVSVFFSTSARICFFLFSTNNITNCCVLNIGKCDIPTSLSINDVCLPIVPYVRDLGVTVNNNLSPSSHISDIVARAHKRAFAIHRTFVSRDVNSLVRAYKVYVRPIIEHNSVVWSPNALHDIDAIERREGWAIDNNIAAKNVPFMYMLALPSIGMQLNKHQILFYSNDRANDYLRRTQTLSLAVY